MKLKKSNSLDGLVLGEYLFRVVYIPSRIVMEEIFLN